MRRQFNWTPFQIDKLSKVQQILTELEKYKPLTLRQIYYQMVSREYIENTKSQYVLLSGLLKHARLEDFISWDDIEDRVRPFHDLRGDPGMDDFIDSELDIFLEGYRRDLLSGQEKRPEIWIEKDALAGIFTRAARAYTIPVVVCRGFTSISVLNDYRLRISSHENAVPVMLYFGDFDPSGVEMLEAMKETLRHEFGIEGIEFKRVALLKEDIEKYRLPHNPDAIKKKDTRSAKHVERFGELAVELDALKPDVLTARIREAIEAELNIDVFNLEVKTWRVELDKLSGLKKRVTAKMNEEKS